MSTVSTGISVSEIFEQILSKASSSASIKENVKIGKRKDGRFELSLTKSGEEVERDFQRAYQLAEEKGPRDKEVMSVLDTLNERWSSFPGVVENKINEAVEEKSFDKALEAGEAAIGEWAALIKEAKLTDPSKLASDSSASGTFIQMLANYEFALERAEKLEEALAVAQLARTIDPTDPENLLSAVVNLSIRLGQPEVALNELVALSDSPAPFVLYGRALAYFAMQQPENATAALQTALRHWPLVAQGISREWTSSTTMPRPGEAVNEMQVLYGYYEVFGSAWASVPGAIDWLRREEQAFQRAGGKQAQHVGLTRTGMKTDGHGNIVSATAQEQEEALSNAKVVGEDEYISFLEVSKNNYAYRLTTRGKELEELLQEVFKQELKVAEKLEAIKDLLKQWPGHAEAAITLARHYAGEKKWDDSLDILEAAIFDLQKFWPEDLVGKGKVEVDWPSNRGLLRAYAHMVVYLAETGDDASARSFSEDYLLINPKDNLGVRQKAIELALKEGDNESALKFATEATDSNAAYIMFGKALALFSLGKKDDATKALHQAVQSRPKVYRELIADKHRMPSKYNPSYVSFFSQEEAYNYNSLWSGLWRNTMGALAWLRKEGKNAIMAAKS
jgi:tetratricopeptide (TPR) repeat protein